MLVCSSAPVSASSGGSVGGAAVYSELERIVAANISWVLFFYREIIESARSGARIEARSKPAPRLNRKKSFGGAPSGQEPVAEMS